MWLIDYLPEWSFYVCFLSSVFLLVGASVINLRSLQLTGTALACAAAVYIGGIETQKSWQARVLDLQAKVALAEQKSVEVNTEIITKTLTEIRLVKDTTDANIIYITEYVAEDLDRECVLTDATVLLHNSASQNEVPRSPSLAAGAPSDVKPSNLLETVVENYGTYYELVERLKAWQNWYYAQKKLFEE